MEPFDILPPNALYDILFALEPKDLLALYISDQHIKKYLNNMDFLDQLYDVYNIEADTFTSWIKKYNEFLVHYNPQLYLYRMESNLLLPSEAYLDNDFTYRLKAIDIVRELNKKLKANSYQFGLAISFMDMYCFNTEPKDEDLLLILLSCIKLTFNLLNDYEAENDDYIEGIKNYPGIKLFTEDEFVQKTKEILTFLNGKLIRPSTILYLPLENDPIKIDLCVLSYYAHELMIYKPSMIYETINYMLTGQYQIYALEELMPICHYLTNTVNTLSTSNYLIANVAQRVQPYLKYKCQDKIFLYKERPFKYNEPWHIGEYEAENKVGEGAYGSIVKIKRKACGKNYVIKKIDNIESSYVEIASLKHLDHPYIIQLCGFDIIKSQLFLPYYPIDLQKLLLTDKIKAGKKYVKQLILALNYVMRMILSIEILNHKILFMMNHKIY